MGIYMASSIKKIEKKRKRKIKTYLMIIANAVVLLIDPPLESINSLVKAAHKGQV